MGIFGFVLGIDHSLFIHFLLATLFYVSFAFSINNCFDAETDRINKNNKSSNPLATGELSYSECLYFSAFLALAGIFIASFLPFNAFLTYVFMTLLALIYSAPPRLKARPPFDIISHGLFFGVLLFLFGLFSAYGSIEGYEFILPSLFFYSVFLELRNHIEDYWSDITSGVKTSAVLFGKKRAELMKWISACIHIIFISVYASYALPVFLSLLVLRKERLIDLLTVILYSALLLEKGGYIKWIL